MYNFSIFIEKEWDLYIARNLELWVFSQWENYDNALSNLKEATELYLGNEKEKTILNKIKWKNYSLTTLSI